MHNNNNKHSVLLALVGILLLSGVVCGVAYMIFSTGDDVSLSLKESEDVTENDDTSKATQTESTSLIYNTIPDDVSGTRATSAGFKLVSKTVSAELRKGRPTYALKVLETDPLAKKLKNSEFDRIKALIAQSYLMEGKITAAAKIAGQVALRSGKNAPLAGWVAGQAAWRSGNYALAEKMFAITAKSPVASAWLSSAGAYWAARAANRDGDKKAAQDWYQVASRHPRTFYGLISLRIIGDRFEFNWETPYMSSSDKKALGLDLKVSAALRLAREGQLSAAITTLGSTKWMKSDSGRRSLLAYFQMQKSPALTLFLARTTRDENGRFYDTALYPESPWEPKMGYEVDKALIHALIRQESRFNPYAVSSTGAKGLMQLMPSTASYMNNGEAISLSHPETNMTVGQKYVKYLLNDKVVNNDLFKMAIAYNAGPGNLSRWTKELKQIDDPMLFIESIPSGETRAFVERVMVNYWIYCMRMGRGVPSLDTIAMLDSPDTLKTAATRMTASPEIAMAQ